MDIDEDVPPQLVEAGDDLAEEEATVKVPITIVTGVCSGHVFNRSSEQWLTLASVPHRLSRCWQDNTLELHLDSTAWQENRRHNEWSDSSAMARCCAFFIHEILTRRT